MRDASPRSGRGLERRLIVAAVAVVSCHWLAARGSTSYAWTRLHAVDTSKVFGAGHVLARWRTVDTWKVFGVGKVVCWALDPGREDVSAEYYETPGHVVMQLPLESGGTLEVTRHDASEQDDLLDAVPGVYQEWRVLRFRPNEGANDLVQSVSKVVVRPVDNGAAFQQDPATNRSLPQHTEARADVLALPYSRSMVSVVLTALSVLGALVHHGRRHNPNQPSTAQPQLRILCIGVGGGNVPAFLANALPECQIDCVELEAAVINAARQGMGFVDNPRVHVAIEDGVEFAARAVARACAADSDDVSDIRQYDALLIDAYDAEGNVPEQLWGRHGGLNKALARGLLKRRGVVAINFLQSVDLAPPLCALHAALSTRGCTFGRGVSVRQNPVPLSSEWWSELARTGELRLDSAGNQIAVYMYGDEEFASPGSDELRSRLRRAGQEIGAEIGCHFNIADLAVRGFREWSDLG